MASSILRLNIWSTRWASVQPLLRSPWLPGLPEVDSQSPPFLLSNAVCKSTGGGVRKADPSGGAAAEWRLREGSHNCPRHTLALRGLSKGTHHLWPDSPRAECGDTLTEGFLSNLFEFCLQEHRCNRKHKSFGIKRPG